MHSLTKCSARTCFEWLLVKASKPQESLAEAKAVVQRCSAKNLFLKISQNSLVHSCFSVNFMKFLRTLLLIEHLWWLLLWAWTNWARKTSGTRPIFRAHIFFLVKKKKILDLQVFSRISKTMKKLQWVSNTTMDTNLLWWSLHIWWRQNCFIYSWIKKKSVVLSELFKHTWWYVWQKQLAALI